MQQSAACNEDDEGTVKACEDILPGKTDVQNEQESTHDVQANGTLCSTSSVRSVGQRDAFMQHPINFTNSNGKEFRSKKRKRKKSYMCEVCGFSTRYPASFINHRRIHTGEKPYKCDSCDYRTINSSRLSVHKMRNHLNNDSEEAKPFLCDICGVRKRRAGDLREHKVTHTGEKRFKCDLCSFRAICAGKLVIHRRKHTGEKPYKCDVCDFKAKMPHTLKKHKLKHVCHEIEAK